MSCDSNYTAELTDVNVCGAEAEAPELYLIESVLLHDTAIFLQKQIVETLSLFLLHTPNY